MKRGLVLVSLLGALVSASAPGCTSGIGLASPRAMNHPVDVAFACFDVSRPGVPTVVPLSNCTLRVDVPSNTRQPPANAAMHMHALVTQSTRGEVGAVDLIARGVLDSDVSVPGYTFVPVGELPTRIVVPPLDPSCTYVASRGAVDGRHPGISIIDTRRFRSGAGVDHSPFPLHAPYVLPTAPSDMVLAPDGGAFWITMDALGVLVRVPIVGSCQLGEIDLVVPLFEDPATPVPFVPGSTTDLTRQCGLAAGTGPVAPFVVDPPRSTEVDVRVDPEPVAIEIDEENGWILVADRALPMIHRVRLADGTLLAPLATGVPVRDVVVTPRVPNSYELAPDPLAGTCSTTGQHPLGSVVPAPSVSFSRYVYAIDETDGSVLAVEYSDPSATGFGEVIPLDVRGARRPDRMAMPVVARALEIITPQYDTTAADPRLAPVGPDACTPSLSGNPNGYGLCLPSAALPSQPPTPSVLRGVFLVVAAADGSIRMVDVYDLDAPCRGRSHGAPLTVSPGTTVPDIAGTDCTAPTVGNDIAVYIRRHRPRVQQLLSSFVTIDAGPTVYFPGGGSVVLQTTGVPTGEPEPAPCTSDASCESGRVCRAERCVSPSEVPSLRLFAADAQADPAALACPATMGMVWGTTTTRGTGSAARTYDLPIVCSIVDPFAAIPETWSATWEGPIPGTYTSSANAHRDASGAFDGTIDTRIDYCSLGVIGRGEATGAAIGRPEEPYEGDMLAIVGAMPTAALDSPSMGTLCRSVVGITQLGEPQLPILARIDHALSTPDMQQEPYVGRLVVDPSTPLENRSGTSIPTLGDAIRCYGDQLLTIEVRSHRAFTVRGSRSGFQHRVGRVADGTCRYDFSREETLQGRAFNDVIFRNTHIAFRPTGVTQTTTANALAEIRMVLTGGPSQLGLDLAASTTGIRQMALPSGLRYSPEMWALYAIESERRGLVEMTLRPLAVTQTSYQ